jgi:hypothetical protein
VPPPKLYSTFSPRPQPSERVRIIKLVSRHVPRLLLLAAVCVVAGVVRPAPAAAAVPCWKQLLNDWYDGRIDKTYPVPCYSQALGHLPTDVDVYSSARDDIRRALASAIASKRHHGTTSTSRTTPGGGTSTPSSGGGTTTGGTTSGRQSNNGPFGEAVDKLNPGSAESLPLPLLILGALALLLVLAGVAGLLVRRRQPPPSAA